MKKLIESLICIFFLTTLNVSAQYDKFGGLSNLKGKKTGYFHTEKINGCWWLITPEGNAFFAKGVESIDLGTERNNPAIDREKAKENLTEQIKSWNFNATGSHRLKLPEMPYVLNLGLASSSTKNMWLLGIVPDYFSPEFRDAIEKRAAEVCLGLANDPWLIGYFTDNEIRWVPDIRSKDFVLDAFLKKDTSSPGYKKALSF